MDYAALFPSKEEQKQKKKRSIRMRCGLLQPPAKTSSFKDDSEICDTIEIASQFFKSKKDLQDRIQALEETLDAVERDIGCHESCVEQDEDLFNYLVYFDCDVDELKKWSEQLRAELAICKQIYGESPVADAKALWMQKYRHILDLNDDGLPYDDGLPF